MNQKGREKEGSEEKRGDKGRTLLCLSSPPNATHVSGLGNNESRSQWDCRHYRVRAGCVCERWLCRRLLLSRWLLPRDRVTFHHLAPWAAFRTAPLGCDVPSGVTTVRFAAREKRTCTGVHHAYRSVIRKLSVSWTVLYGHTHKEKCHQTRQRTQTLLSFHLFLPSLIEEFLFFSPANWQWKTC